MTDVLRLMDANANRARETIRVMEDAARFLLDDAELSQALKSLRHDLAAALAGVDGLDAWRNTPGDVGTAATTESEYRREGAWGVATAASKRLGEALRSLEEYSKTLGPDAADVPTALEQIRYRGYDLQQRLLKRLGTGRPAQWRLCVLLTADLCPDGDWRRVAEQALAGGADCLQLREKNLDAGPLRERAAQLVELAHAAGASVVINDRPDVALVTGADGVHLGQDDLSVTDARRLVGHRLLIGVSTGHLPEVDAAAEAGADYVGAGPMFTTNTKAKDHLAGPTYVQKLRNAHPRLPHLAIGGITPDNARDVIDAGARGLAVSSAVCGADDPADVCQRLVEIVTSAEEA